MLRQFSKISSLSLRRCSIKREFSTRKSKGTADSEMEWWNKPINELKPTIKNESSSTMTQSFVPTGSGVGLPPKILSVTDKSSKRGVSFSNYQDTPCAEKKFSPCAEKKQRPKTSRQKKREPNREEPRVSSNTSDCSHHKDLVPPSSELQQLKDYDLKSSCTSFHLKTEN